MRAINKRLNNEAHFQANIHGAKMKQSPQESVEIEFDEKQNGAVEKALAERLKGLDNV